MSGPSWIVGFRCGMVVCDIIAEGHSNVETLTVSPDDIRADDLFDYWVRVFDSVYGTSVQKDERLRTAFFQTIVERRSAPTKERSS